MKKNIGTRDRLIRLFLSGVFFVFALWFSSLLALALGIFTLFEALAGWCILYQLLGKSSCTRQKCALLVLSLLCFSGSCSAWGFYDDYYDDVYIDYYDPYYANDGYYFTLSDGTRWVTYDPAVYDYFASGYYYSGYYLTPMSSYDAYYYGYSNYGYQPYWMTLGYNTFAVFYVP